MQFTYDRLKRKALSIADLPAKDMESFCAIASPLKYNKGQILLKEGETCRNIYFVQQGYLRSYYTRDGLEINTGFHFEDSFATNLKSLRTQLPSESFLAAAEPVLVFRFTSEMMKDLYARCPPIVDFGKKLLEILAIEQEEELNLFRLYSAEERFRHFERTVSYKMVLMLKPLYDIVHPGSLFPRYIELGAFRPLTRRFIELNIPRETAIYLSNRRRRFARMDPDDKQGLIPEIRNIRNQLPICYHIQ